jgi:hypothetical protein
MPEHTHITTHRTLPWILDQILPADHIHPYSIIGPAGSGKTFLLIDWALCCARGTSWLGYSAPQQNVLFVRPDRNMQDFHHRALAWKTVHPHTEGEVYGTLHLLDSSDYRKTAQSIYQEIVHCVHAHNISLIILDEWESFGASAPEMGQMLQERFHLTLVYSLLGRADPLTRTPHRFLVHSVTEEEATRKLAITLTLPSTSPLADIDLGMRRVATPGTMIDSFRESCVVFEPRVTLPGPTGHE